MGPDEGTTFAGEIRFSRDMRLLRTITLGLGIGLGAGVFVLLGPDVYMFGARTPVTYLLVALSLLPTAFSLAELSSISKHGIRSLLEDSQSPQVSYATAWVLWGGTFVLAALLARGGAEYLRLLFSNVLAWQIEANWIAPVLILGLMFNNVLGTRESHWLNNVVVLGALATLAALGGRAILGPSSAPVDITQTAASFGLTRMIAVLSGGLWGLALLLLSGQEVRNADKDLPKALLTTLVVTSVVGAFVSWIVLRIASQRSEVTSVLLANVAQSLAGSVGSITILAVGTGVLLAALNRTLLALGYISQDMSRRGYLPPSWRMPHPQFHTSHRLLIGAGVLAALLSFGCDPMMLAYLTALGFLGAMALINLPTVLSGGSNLPRQRFISLPFPPLIPGVAIAIHLFLMASLPAPVLFVGAGWILAGVATYFLYSRLGITEAQQGVVIFSGEPEARVETDFRVLVPLSNPLTAEALINAASLLVQARKGEVVALHVVVVPEQTPLLAGQRIARRQRHLLERAVENARARGVAVFPIVRIAHRPVAGILDTAIEEECDLILMGWGGEQPSSPEYDIGSVIDQVVTDAACDVAVLKGQIPEDLRRILVPTAGGPHAPAAVQFGLDLAADTGARVTVLNLVVGPFSESAREQAQARIDQTLEDIDGAWDVDQQISRATDVRQGILDEASRYDLLLLGASGEGFLDEIVFGGLPEYVARTTRKPVMLVKRHQKLHERWLRRMWRSLYTVFPNLTRSEQIEVYRTLRRDARPDVDFFVLIVLSAVIATLGLLQDSPAVIIGAMLVAPLMTPILGLSMGVARGDVRLLRLAAESTLKGVTMALVVAVGVVLLTPQVNLTSAVLVRTHPTALDLVVALASGAAGAYAVGRKDVAAALPGVAIAAALVPPLCSVGVGIALAQSAVTGGALLLFATNLVAITLAGALVFLLLGFRPDTDERERQKRVWRGLIVTLVLLVAIAVPLELFLVQTVRQERRQQTVYQVLSKEWESQGVILASFDLQRESRGFNVAATVYASESPDEATVKTIQTSLEDALGMPVRLEITIIPVVQMLAE